MISNCCSSFVKDYDGYFLVLVTSGRVWPVLLAGMSTTTNIISPSVVSSFTLFLFFIF